MTQPGMARMNARYSYAGTDPVPQVCDRRNEYVRENEGENEPEDVGDEQHPPHESSAPIAAPGTDTWT